MNVLLLQVSLLCCSNIWIHVTCRPTGEAKRLRLRSLKLHGLQAPLTTVTFTNWLFHKNFSYSSPNWNEILCKFSSSLSYIITYIFKKCPVFLTLAFKDTTVLLLEYFCPCFSYINVVIGDWPGTAMVWVFWKIQWASSCTRSGFMVKAIFFNVMVWW